ncbi:MAG: toprim domain-containing protein [Deltaproteobacteria bacterium]|nr:toprim domain-containing protein [Deltaproteobacteria bacterium]
MPAGVGISRTFYKNNRTDQRRSNGLFIYMYYFVTGPEIKKQWCFLMSMFLPELIQERLLNSEYRTEKTKVTDNSISPLLCSQCGRPEAWTYSYNHSGNAPWVIICNRKDKCGARTRILDLFPDIVADIEKKFPKTKQDKNLPATKYLEYRGISEEIIKGLDYYYLPNILKSGRGGIMFRLDDGGANGRVINPTQDMGKSYNIGSMKGKFWFHPGQPPKWNEKIFICEGIITALSLWTMGYQAIAVLTSGAPVRLRRKKDAETPLDKYLSQWYEHNGNWQKIVFAPDADKAGRQALRHWGIEKDNKKSEENYMILDYHRILPNHGDWNDLRQKYRSINEAHDYFEDKYEEFSANARLAMTETAHEYATMFQEQKGYAKGLFEFKGRTYFSTTKIKQENEKEQNTSSPVKKGPPLTVEVGDFTVDIDHIRLNDENPEEPINTFFLNVKCITGKQLSFLATAADLGSPEAVYKTFYARGPALWTGDRAATIALARKFIETKVQTVRQPDVIGYDEQSRCHLFNDFLINLNGDFIAPDQHGFLKTGSNLFVKPPRIKTIIPKKGIEPKKIYSLLIDAWGERPAVALSFVVASWFVHVIKPKIGFFPFLSLYGDTQTGKSRLACLLNNMQCIAEEGLPMHKLNTGKGEIRKLAQRSSLSHALIEANKKDSVRFDFEMLLPLYNFGNPLQIRALKTTDMRTSELQFRSALFFIQNKEPFNSKAQHERVVSVHFSEDDITSQTAVAFNQLVRIPQEELAWIFLFIMQHRKDIEVNWFDFFENNKIKFLQETGDPRITENHALLYTFHELISNIIGVESNLYNYFIKIAKAKVLKCAHRIETEADSFFNKMNQISDIKLAYCQESDDKCLYLNIPACLRVLKEEGFPIPLETILRPSLEEHPAWIRSGYVRRGYFGEAVKKNTKVWVFDIKKLLKENE